MPEADRKMTRREFLREIGRYGMGLLLGGGIAMLLNRDREKCINQGLCRGCSRFEGCHLPQAMSAKEAMARKEDNV